MSSAADRISEMLDVFRRNHAEGRLAHAFVVQGAPAGEGRIFAEAALQILFCEGLTRPCCACRECHKVSHRTHPDIQWLEPQKKSRTFDVDKQIRPMLRDFAQTSYQGGWKAVVLFDADRLNDSHANAILKGLEEPGQRRLWLLLTAHPDKLLTTIHSRCQRIVLTQGVQDFQGSWIEPLRSWLLDPQSSGGGIVAMADAAFLAGVLGRQEDEITTRVRAELGDEEVDAKTFEARVRSQLVKVRSEILSYVTLWRRDVLALAGGGDESVLHFRDDADAIRTTAERMGLAAALQAVQKMSEINRRFDRNMPALQVLESAFLL